MPKIKMAIIDIRIVKTLHFALVLCLLSATLAAAQNLPDRMPALTLPDLDNKPVALASFEGKTLLVNFWATWCSPCVKEIPLFVSLRNKYMSRGFEVVGINIWDGPEQARSFAQKKNMNYPILVGDDTAASAFGGFQALPVTFLISGKGRIVKRYFAIDEKGFSGMDQEIAELLDTGKISSATAGADNISLLTAFLAGILSFLSPCVLPLIPSYVSFITGISHEEYLKPGPLSGETRRVTLMHSLLFVIGFSIIFIILGASATFVGSLFTAYRGVLEKIVGVIIVVFGLQISGLINLKFLLMEKKIHMQNKPLGYLGTILVGLSFGIGWTPCIGPILDSILGFAATIGNLGAGMLLLTLYSLGLGIPFLMSAVMVQSFFDYFKKVRRFIPIITMASGIFLVFVGVLIFTGYFVKLAVLFQSGINALFPWLSNLG